MLHKTILNSFLLFLFAAFNFSYLKREGTVLAFFFFIYLYLKAALSFLNLEYLSKLKGKRGFNHSRGKGKVALLIMPYGG